MSGFSCCLKQVLRGRPSPPHAARSCPSIALSHSLLSEAMQLVMKLVMVPVLSHPGHRAGTGRAGGLGERKGLTAPVFSQGRLQSYGSPPNGQSCALETCCRDLGPFPVSRANHRHGEPLWFLKLTALSIVLLCASPSAWNVLTYPEKFQLITQESPRGTNCFSLLPIMVASSRLFHPYTNNNISLLILRDRLIDWLID